MAGDGDCFYHSVGKQLELHFPILHAKDRGHMALRSLAASYVTENFEEFKDFLSLNDGETTQMYVNRMFEKGEWVDDPHVSALAKALELTINVFRSDGTQTIVNSGMDITIELAYHVDQHYDSLRRMSSG